MTGSVGHTEGDVLIVGAARGIGRATAELMAGRGWRVIAADRDECVDTCEAITSAGGHATSLQVDLADAAAAGAIFADLAACGVSLGAVVITAAMMGPLVEVPDYELDLWRRIVDVNLTGTFFFARAAAEHLAAGGGGRLVLFMSGAGRSPGKVTIAPYIVTKAAIPMMVNIFTKAYGKRGVLVAAVDPGRTNTPMVMGPVYDSIESAMAVDDLPAGRVLDAGEVAEVVAFLCSRQASGVTNAVWGVSTRF